MSKLYDLNDLENFFVKDLKDNIKVDFPNESGSVEVEKTIISDDIFYIKIALISKMTYLWTLLLVKRAYV